MFLAIVVIILGLFLLLNAMGITLGINFWGFFWAIVVLAIGIKMLIHRGKCPMCGWHHCGGRMHSKMQGNCGCGHDHDHDSDGQDHH